MAGSIGYALFWGKRCRPKGWALPPTDGRELLTDRVVSESSVTHQVTQHDLLQHATSCGESKSALAGISMGGALSTDWGRDVAANAIY